MCNVAGQFKKRIFGKDGKKGLIEQNPDGN